jgi:hypothetical protein
MKRPLLALAAAAVALSASACDRSPAAVPSNALSPAEARALAGQLATSTAAALGVTRSLSFSQAADPGAPSRSGGSIDVPFSNTAPCPKGGTLSVAGHSTLTWDGATRTGSAEVSATSTPTACAHDNGKGATVTITGNPSLQVHASAAMANGVPDVMAATQTGGFTWQRSDGASGSCTVDLASVVDYPARTAKVTGTFCGISIDVSTTFTP